MVALAALAPLLLCLAQPGQAAASQPPPCFGESNPVACLVSRATGAGSYSETCTSPVAVVADGYAGPVYLKLREQSDPTDPNTTWICYRAVGGAVDVGGRLDVVSASVGPAIPTVQPIASDTDPCQASGNLISDPHPLFAGSLGDPTNPPDTSLMFDAYATASQVSLCTVDSANPGGSFAEQVVVPVSAVAPPLIVDNSDAPAQPGDAPPLGPSGYPSSTCQSDGGTQMADMGNLDNRVWAFSYQPGPGQLDVCVRQQGQLSAGGMLSVNASGYPGITPVLSLNASPSACTVPVVTITSPARISISRTSGLTNPATVCVTEESTTDAYQIGTAGTLKASIPITWTPDPGTP